MAVVRTRLYELRKRQLLQCTRRAVADALCLDHLRHQVLRQYHPPQPQPGCQGIARRAQVYDVFRVEPLQGADRLSVVTEVAVVVVLQNQPARATRPVDRRGPPVGVERYTRREPVGRCQQHGPGPRHPAQVIGPGPGFVHREVRDAQTRFREQPPVHVQCVRLDGHLAHPPLAQHRPHQFQGVHEARGYHDPFRVRVHAAGQIVGRARCAVPRARADPRSRRSRWGRRSGRAGTP